MGGVTVREKKESSVEREACSRAESELGVRNTKFVTPGDTGWPDRIFWIKGGRPLLIEFKRPGEEPRPKQEYNIGILKKLGYNVEVHDNVERALCSIARALEAGKLSKTKC